MRDLRDVILTRIARNPQLLYDGSHAGDREMVISMLFLTAAGIAIDVVLRAVPATAFAAARRRAVRFVPGGIMAVPPGAVGLTCLEASL